MKMNSSMVIFCLAVLCFASYINVAMAQDTSTTATVNSNEADELDKIMLHSFEHFDYLDILYRLKGHNSDTWIVLFYIDEDHHKDTRDRLKELVFKAHPDFRFAEVNISNPNYSPIKQAIRFPQNAGPEDYPMVLLMKNQMGHMIYGPGVAQRTADLIAENEARGDEPVQPSQPPTSEPESHERNAPQLREPEKAG